MSSWVSWLRLLRRKDILTLAPSGSPFRNADKTLRQFSRGSGLHRRVGREVLASVRSSALRRIRSIGPSSWPAPSPGSTNQAGVRSCSRYRIDIKSAPAMTYWQGDWWSRSRSRQRSKECHFRPPRTFGNGSGVPLAESQEALPGTSAQGRYHFRINSRLFGFRFVRGPPAGSRRPPSNRPKATAANGSCARRNRSIAGSPSAPSAKG